ncbi:TPA_asm: hypothetical protein [Capsaspora MELD virus 1]|nr:TPA_asm: hypothetical protein [Capsaspora MELD virus 1]
MKYSKYIMTLIQFLDPVTVNENATYIKRQFWLLNDRADSLLNNINGRMLSQQYNHTVGLKSKRDVLRDRFESIKQTYARDLAYIQEHSPAVHEQVTAKAERFMNTLNEIGQKFVEMKLYELQQANPLKCSVKQPFCFIVDGNTGSGMSNFQFPRNE